MKSRVHCLAEIPSRWKLSGRALWPCRFSPSPQESKCAPTSPPSCSLRQDRRATQLRLLRPLSSSGRRRESRAYGVTVLTQVANSVQLASLRGAGGVNSLGSRGVTEDVQPPKELTPVTSHSIAFVAILCPIPSSPQSGKHLNSSSGETWGDKTRQNRASNQNLEMEIPTSASDFHGRWWSRRRMAGMSAPGPGAILPQATREAPASVLASTAAFPFPLSLPSRLPRFPFSPYDQSAGGGLKRQSSPSESQFFLFSTHNFGCLMEELLTGGGGRQERRRCPGGVIRPGNTSCAARPILRCLPGFPSSAK